MNAALKIDHQNHHSTVTIAGRLHQYVCGISGQDFIRLTLARALMMPQPSHAGRARPRVMRTCLTPPVAGCTGGGARRANGRQWAGGLEILATHPKTEEKQTVPSGVQNVPDNHAALGQQTKQHILLARS
jgi:hypothetical protein